MKRSRAVAATLVALIAGGWTLLAFPADVAQADHEIIFPSCTPPTPSPEPTVSPAPSPTPKPTPAPPPECTPDEGMVIKGTRKISFEVDAGGSRRIREVKASLVAETEGVPDPGPVTLDCAAADVNDDANVCEHDASVAPDEGLYSFQWNAGSLTPYNGSYKLVVETHTCTAVSGWQCNISEHRSSASRSKLIVNESPSKPGPPRVILTTENTTTVEWDKAPEPDVLSYTLYSAFTDNRNREPDKDDFEAVLTTTATATRHEAPVPGAYWYKILVTRRSVVTPDDGISSSLSDVSGPGTVAGLEPTPAPEDAPPPPPPRRLRPAAVRRPPPVPDAPFSAVLPYDVPDGDVEAVGPDAPEEGADPRGPVLPLAVGAFLVSASLALTRMPY